MGTRPPPDGRPNPACADVPTQEAPVLLFVKVVPSLAAYTLDQQEHVAVHEMGHTLGFWHWAACTSAMSVCYDFTEPTAVDADNYNKAYWVEAVTAPSAWSSSSGRVSLTWMPVNSSGQQLCNEKEFSIWRRNKTTGSFDIPVATAGQNSMGVTLSGQPGYDQCYVVWSMTEARAIPYGGYDTIGVDVRPGSGGQDTDCDYWTDVQEDFIGTDPYDNCADNSGDDAWPPDLDNNRRVNVNDVLMYGPIFQCEPQPCYDPRFDLDTDGSMTILDVLALSIMNQMPTCA